MIELAVILQKNSMNLQLLSLLQREVKVKANRSVYGSIGYGTLLETRMIIVV